jgi:NTP pyrophosphatase (non-canonical NTP hydrolase)
MTIQIGRSEMTGTTEADTRGDVPVLAPESAVSGEVRERIGRARHPAGIWPGQHPKQTGEVIMELNKDFEGMVCEELERARAKNAPMNSLHEGYAVILEELDEFWDEVKKKKGERNTTHLLQELVQVAAMCQKTAEDVVL